MRNIQKRVFSVSQKCFSRRSKLNEEETARRLRDLNNEFNKRSWKMVNKTREGSKPLSFLSLDISLENESDAMMKAVQILEKLHTISKDLDHHPDFFFDSYRSTLTIDLFTHSCSGTSELDFMMAKKINEEL